MRCSHFALEQPLKTADSEIGESTTNDAED